MGSMLPIVWNKHYLPDRVDSSWPKVACASSALPPRMGLLGDPDPAYSIIPYRSQDVVWEDLWPSWIQRRRYLRAASVRLVTPNLA
jgi:hypothetical protein